MKACGSSKVLIAFECFYVVLIRRLMKKQHIHTYINAKEKALDLNFSFGFQYILRTIILRVLQDDQCKQ
jgi:hypothetical protein